MKLHLDRDAFGVLLEDIHSRTGYRTDVLEKDYYVVLILSELAEMQKDGLVELFELTRGHSENNKKKAEQIEALVKELSSL